MGRRVIVTVREVRGFCRAGYKVGEKFVFDDANILLNESDRICAAAFSAIYPKVYALRRGLDLSLLGSPYSQCPDPGGWSSYHKEGGTVLFEISVG
jgi:uncharacterized repeat protein (TIGR04076 family)